MASTRPTRRGRWPEAGTPASSTSQIAPRHSPQMTTVAPLDFGGHVVGTSSAPVTVTVPLSIALSQLPSDTAITVPPQLIGVLPVSTGNTTYPPQLINVFGDVSATVRLASVALDDGVDFGVDASGPWARRASVRRSTSRLRRARLARWTTPSAAPSRTSTSPSRAAVCRLRCSASSPAFLATTSPSGWGSSSCNRCAAAGSPPVTAARCGRGPQAHRVRARSLLRAP